MSIAERIFTWTVIRRVLIGCAILGLLVLLAVWMWVSSVTRDVPDHRTLAEYQPPITTRVHAGDGKLIAEFAAEHRIYVPYEAMPEHLVYAFVSAEDKKFFSHGGLDYIGILRAAINNVQGAIFGGGGLQGASTITQQVAKNMLLTNDRSLIRKVKEATIAQRMERAFTKEEILELYLNEIYLGGSSYGVASAALNYFNRSLPELSLSEAALLAAMPKAPGNVNPYRRPEAAFHRRNWVLGRMAANGYITKEEAEAAAAEPIVIRSRFKGEEYAASAYFVEELRRDLTERVGEQTLNEGGLSIRSTIDTELQLAAQRALREGLEAYDRRKGYRGPIATIDVTGNAAETLATIELPGGYGSNEAAVITAVDDQNVDALLIDGQSVKIEAEDVEWARRTYTDAERDVKGLSVGDVVLVDVDREPIPDEEQSEDSTGPTDAAETDVAEASKDDDAKVETVIIADTDIPTRPVGAARLAQIPEVDGGLLALDPHTGRVLAMAGGYSFWKEGTGQFNRTTQARRQPGSAFKPFVYAAALDSIDPDTGKPYTPVSQILDAPFVHCDYTRVGEDPCYKPGNYSAGQFYGMSTMRLGLEKSRNAMTVRLAQEIGMERVSEFSRQIGLYDDLPPYLAMSLGAGEVTIWDLAKAYATLVNGGKEVEPTLFDRVQDRNGETLYRHDERACDGCQTDWQSGLEPPQLVDERAQLMNPVTAYQVVHMLEGVVERGTATVAKRVGKPLAGKTGTTDNYNDAWFMGFSPDLVVGVYVGFDKDRSLGPGEAGGRVAAPIFTSFMEEALADEPSIPFRIPAGVRLVAVDAKTGELAGRSSGLTILEAFKPGTEPGVEGEFESDLNIFNMGSIGRDRPTEPVSPYVGIGPDSDDESTDDNSDTSVQTPPGELSESEFGDEEVQTGGLRGSVY